MRVLFLRTWKFGLPIVLCLLPFQLAIFHTREPTAFVPCRPGQILAAPRAALTLRSRDNTSQSGGDCRAGANYRVGKVRPRSGLTQNYNFSRHLESRGRFAKVPQIHDQLYWLKRYNSLLWAR